jgi:hypothetical protein
MRLIDIILESNAVEKAKQMGLVKKPGVALYGPPGDGNPASHKIRGGELTPLKATDPSQGMGQHGAIGSQSDLEKSTPSGNLSTGDKPTQFSTIEEISQRVRNTFTPDGRVGDIQQTLSAVTSHFGRETCAPVYKFGPEFYTMSGHPPITFESMAGVFHFINDIIGLRTEVPDKPISEYDVYDVKSFQTSVHEALHSSRWFSDSVPRDQRSLIWDHIKNHKMPTLLDEGMTEYLAREITSTTLSDAPGMGMAEIDWEKRGSYPIETDAVRFMVEYGNFDVVAAYQNHSYIRGEDGISVIWEYLEQAHEAHDNAIIEILTRVGITEEELQEAGIISELREAREVGIFPLMDWQVRYWMKVAVDFNLKPYQIDDFLDDLSNAIRYAL